MGSVVCIKCNIPYTNCSLLGNKCNYHRKLLDDYHCCDCNNIYNSHCNHVYKWKPYCLQIRLS